MTITNARLDLRDVNDADVYLNDELVASLTRLPGDEIRFACNSNSQTPGLSARDRSVSWSLLINGNYPLTTQVHLTFSSQLARTRLAMFAFCRRARSAPMFEPFLNTERN
jgi:hypothetical protein